LLEDSTDNSQLEKPNISECNLKVEMHF